MISQLTPRL